MRICSFLLALALAGCATSGPVLARPDHSTLGVGGGAGATIGSRDDAFVPPVRLPESADSAWPALVASYRALGIPVEAVDAASRTLGSAGIAARNRFLGRPISEFLACGGAAGVANVADQHHVRLSVFSVLTRDASGTAWLQTRVAGTAKDPFTSVPARPCSTTGVLESRVEEALTALLRGETVLPAAAPVGPLSAPPPSGVPAAARRRPMQPAHAALLAAGGMLGGAVGTLAGASVGADCEQRCFNARGMLGPLVGNAVLVPIGVHVSNARRGSLVQSVLASAGWAALGAVVSGLSDERWGVLAVVPGQLLTSVLIERSTTGQLR